MNFIMEQGNFGVKMKDEKIAKAISVYSDPKIMFNKLQEIGKAERKLLKKYPILYAYSICIWRCFFYMDAFEAERRMEKDNRRFPVSKAEKTTIFTPLWNKKQGPKRRLAVG